MRAAALAALLLLPGCCAAGPGRAAPRSAAAYQAHVAELLDDAPGGFTAVLAPPFVVIGDGPPDGGSEGARDIVAWAVHRLKADYFALDPGPILNIWIFNGEESYRHHVNVLFGGVPPSPYGYYAPCDGALVINIALGGGTLIHEMVHAFMEANFPESPTWFNEGLASLYEHTEDSGGHIRGRVNWRLPGLQAAVKAGSSPQLSAVLSGSRGDFYDEDDRGMNYAAARYLLYYLQERGVLVRYYHQFHAARAADPTGIETLKAVLGEQEMSAIQARWERFVVKLPSP